MSDFDPQDDSMYWAAIADPSQDQEGSPEDYVQALTRKVAQYTDFYASSGLFERDKRAYMTLHGLSPDGEGVSYKVTRGGAGGQLASLKVNQWANLIQHQASLITAKRPGLDTRASNTDSRSTEQSKLGGDVLENQISTLGIEATTREMTKMSLALRESWLWTKWNSNGGEPYAPDDNGKMMKTGSMETSFHFGQDVIRDHTALGNKTRQWVIVRDFANKYDLSAKFPEQRDAIMGQSRTGENAYRVEFQANYAESDFVPVYNFFHVPSESLENGRQTQFLLGGDGPLTDGPLGYGGKLPVLDMSPARVLGTPFGYSPMHDLLALQTIYDALYSGAMTNELAFVVRRMLVPRGQPISTTQLSTDLGVIYYDPALPTPTFLETPLTTGERFQAIQQIEQVMQTLSGINDVIRGNGEGAGTKAASGLALLQNQALQFMSGLEFEYGNIWKRWGELALAIIRERASAPQMIAIAGKNKEATLKTFLGTDLANSYTVSVDLGDPMAKTAAGREQRAIFLAQQGMLGAPGSPQTAANYFEVAQTGTLQKIMDEATAEDDLITRENEAIMRGEVPAVSEFDTPALHYAKHAMVAFSHEARDQADAEQKAQNPVTGQSAQPSPILNALRQHMILHRMAEQKMAATQNAQAAALAMQQMQQAPQMVPPPGGPPAPGQGPSGPPSGPPPGPKMPQPAGPPPNAMPMPGVQ